jgi:hypothetical protein
MMSAFNANKEGKSRWLPVNQTLAAWRSRDALLDGAGLED